MATRGWNVCLAATWALIGTSILIGCGGGGTKEPVPLPTASAFGWMFAFGGKLYFINGDSSNSATPNDQDTGTDNVFYASAVRGAVGTWTLNPSFTIKARNKGILFAAFGQVIDGEGIYNGSPGSSEFERSTVNSGGNLSSWNGLTGANVPSANVYNALGQISWCASNIAWPPLWCNGSCRKCWSACS